MKKCLADTNFYLRFILQDNSRQVQEVEKYLQKARAGQLEIVFLNEVILEMEFVLKKVYLTPKEKIIKALAVLFKTEYLAVQNRELWLEAIKIYQEKNLDFFDIFLFLKAQKEKAEVLSFDKDFQKLAKSFKGA